MHTYAHERTTRDLWAIRGREAKARAIRVNYAESHHASRDETSFVFIIYAAPPINNADFNCINIHPRVGPVLRIICNSWDVKNAFGDRVARPRDSSAAVAASSRGNSFAAIFARARAAILYIHGPPHRPVLRGHFRFYVGCSPAEIVQLRPLLTRNVSYISARKSEHCFFRFVRGP